MRVVRNVAVLGFLVLLATGSSVADEIRFSVDPSRIPSTPLDDAFVNGEIYVFLHTPPGDIPDSVDFVISRQGSAVSTHHDSDPPFFDLLAGSVADDPPNPFDIDTLLPDFDTYELEVTAHRGTASVVSEASFNVRGETTFTAISDAHICPDGAWGKSCWDTNKRPYRTTVRRRLRHAGELHDHPEDDPFVPDDHGTKRHATGSFVISLGDNIEDFKRKAIANFFEHSLFEPPHYIVLGNHDIRRNRVGMRDEAKEEFNKKADCEGVPIEGVVPGVEEDCEDLFIETNYHWQEGGWHFIGLNSGEDANSRTRHKYPRVYFTEAQLTWLRTELDALPEDSKSVVLFWHRAGEEYVETELETVDEMYAQNFEPGDEWKTHEITLELTEGLYELAIGGYSTSTFSVRVDNVKVVYEENDAPIFRAYFTYDEDDFEYKDDLFRDTQAANRADGVYNSDGGYLVLELDSGGERSGGFSRSFELDDDATVKVSFDYKMTEISDYAQVLMSINGNLSLCRPDGRRGLGQIQSRGIDGEDKLWERRWIEVLKDHESKIKAVFAGHRHNARRYLFDLDTNTDGGIEFYQLPSVGHPDHVGKDRRHYYGDLWMNVKLLADGSLTITNDEQLRWRFKDCAGSYSMTMGGIELSEESIDEGESVTVSGTVSHPRASSEAIFSGTARWDDGVESEVAFDPEYQTFEVSRDFPDDHPATDTAQDPFTVDITVMDPVAREVFQMSGSGENDEDYDSGWRSFDVVLGPLPAKSYDLAIGGYNNKVSHGDAVTKIYIDDVEVSKGDLTRIFFNDFDGIPGPFVHADDLFRSTNQPEYSSGSRKAGVGEFNSWGLVVNLGRGGGGSEKNVFGMSGGFRRSFELDTESVVVVSFRYRMTLNKEYLKDEFSQVLMSIDGQLYGQSVDATSPVLSVLNVAPIVDPPVVSPEPSLEAVVATASFTDPAFGVATEQFIECTVDYGDGSGPMAGTLEGSTCTGPAYTYPDDDDDDTFTVTVTVTDDDGGVGSTSSPHVVLNVAPTVATPVVAPEPSNEGAAVVATATFTDPAFGVPTESFACTVDYGDGSGPIPGTLEGSTCTGPAYTYPDDDDDDTFTVTVTVTDDDGGVGSTSSPHVVLNVAPTVDAGPGGRIDERTTFVSSGSFADPGADTWSATVDWGDSSVEPLALNPDKSFALSHEYDVDGIFTLTVTVTDDDGGVGSSQATVKVDNLDPYYSIDANRVIEGTMRYPTNVLYVPDVSLPADLFVPNFLPGSLGLNALDVQPNGDVIFSPAQHGYVSGGGGLLHLFPGRLYRRSAGDGAITTELDFNAHGLPLEDVDAVDLLSDGS